MPLIEELPDNKEAEEKLKVSGKKFQTTETDTNKMELKVHDMAANSSDSSTIIIEEVTNASQENNIPASGRDDVSGKIQLNST